MTDKAGGTIRAKHDPDRHPARTDGGLIPRYRWWSIPIIGVIWSIELSTLGDPSISLAQIWIAGFVLGALNGAIGVAFTWALARHPGYGPLASPVTPADHRPSKSHGSLLTSQSSR